MNLWTTLFYPGDAFVLLAANVLVQIAVVVALAWALSSTLAPHRAAMRHGICLIALGCVLISPIEAYLAARADLSLVSLRLSEKFPSPFGRVTETSLPSPFGRGVGGEGVGGARSTAGFLHTIRPHADPLPAGEGTIVEGEGTSAPVPPSVPGDSLHAALGMIAVLWLAGVVLLLVRLLHACWGIARLRRSLQSVTGGEADIPVCPKNLAQQGRQECLPHRLQAILPEVRRAVGAKTMPRLATWLAGTDLAGPITIGILRPVVVLPEKLLERLDTRGLRDVLIHEFAHALRRDPLVGFLQRLAAVFYWPYPPVHLLNRCLARAREEVCDNYVLRQGDAPDYAETLLTVSQTVFSNRVPAALGLFHPHGKLEQRVAGLLDERRSVMVRTPRVTLVVLASLFVTTMFVIAGTRLLQAEPPPSPAPATAPVPLLPPLLPAKPAPPPQASDRIQPFDVLQIRVLGTILDQPIDGYYLVELDGRVALGPAYGRANVKNLTPEQAEKSIWEQLKKILVKPDVQVTLARRTTPPPSEKNPYRVQPLDVLRISAFRISGNRARTIVENPVDDVYPVEPDGRVPLGPGLGRVDVKSLTVDQAEETIARYLAKTMPTAPKVQVSWARRDSQWREVVFPRLPYTISPGDVLSVRVLGTIIDQPIDGSFTVEATGTIPLRPAYGRAQVQGLTVEAAEKAIQKKLEEVLKKPDVQVAVPPFPTGNELIRSPGAGQWRDVPPPKAPYTIKPGDVLLIDLAGLWPACPARGVYLVEPAGTVPLPPGFGRVDVRGLTLEGAEKAIQEGVKKILSQPNIQKPPGQPEVQVTLGGWMSEGDSLNYARVVHPTSRENRRPRRVPASPGSAPPNQK